MRVVDKELYLGAALTQIVESTRFSSMRKASAAIGHYEINETRRLLIRYSRSPRGPWYFTFRPRDLHLIRDEMAAGHAFFLGLVCGTTATCLLTTGQIGQVLDLPTTEAQPITEAQSIRVHTRPGASLSVSGSGGTLDGKVTHHAFPTRLFR